MIVILIVLILEVAKSSHVMSCHVTLLTFRFPSASIQASRARKEALFVGKTNDLAAEERNNQLRWMTKLGEEAMSPRSKEEVTEDR